MTKLVIFLFECDQVTTVSASWSCNIFLDDRNENICKNCKTTRAKCKKHMYGGEGGRAHWALEPREVILKYQIWIIRKLA